MNGTATWLYGRESRTRRSLPATEMTLAKGECRSYRRDGVLRCLRGSLWVTLSGHSHDYIVEAGQSMRLTPGLAVVQALSASTMEVSDVGR